jgi:DMSO reductase family type II enzyme heme b subunit
MKERIALIPAPTSMQPGGYVPKAYPDRSEARTPWAEVEVVARRTAPRLTIRVSWPCPEATLSLTEGTDRFVDAAALLAPSQEGAPWITMGAPNLGVEGLLWRADRDAPIEVRAEGLGTLERKASRPGWRLEADLKQGIWQLAVELDDWRALRTHRQLAVAVWQGRDAERGGLKSVSPGWLEVKL